MTVTEAKDITGLTMIAESWREECNSGEFGLDTNMIDFLAELDEMIHDEYSTLIVMKRDGKPVGLMGMVINKSPFGRNWIANEHFWYVLPEHRGVSSIRMIEFAFRWAKQKGCSHVMMNASYLASDLHDKVCEIYEKFGMKKFESVYLVEV